MIPCEGNELAEEPAAGPGAARTWSAAHVCLEGHAAISKGGVVASGGVLDRIRKNTAVNHAYSRGDGDSARLSQRW